MNFNNLRLYSFLDQPTAKLLLVLLWAVLLPVLSLAQGTGWKSGVAKTVITPIDSIWMAGYAVRDHAAEGSLHELWAKALVIQDSVGNKAVFVSTDLLGLPKNVADDIADRLISKFELDRSQIMLTSSHTHSGPVLSESLYDIYPLTSEQRHNIEKYSQWLVDNIVEVVSKAMNDMQSVQVYSGTSQVRFAVNRRNNKEEEVLHANQLNGPIDHSVPVIKLEHPSGSLQAIVFGYACHATTLNGYQWSGDYPGFAQVNIESKYPGAVALFFAGCGGDQNPLPRRTIPLAKQYGSELSAAVFTALDQPMLKLKPYLKTTYKELDLPYGTLPTINELESMTRSETSYYRQWAKRWIKTINEGKPIPASYPSYPIQTWQIGSQTWVALGGEVVVDYAVSLKQLLGQDLFIAAYANDVMAYIPSVRVLKEGGYEGLTSMYVYGLPAAWSSEVQDNIVSEVQRQVQQLKTKSVEK